MLAETIRYCICALNKLNIRPEQRQEYDTFINNLFNCADDVADLETAYKKLSIKYADKMLFLNDCIDVEMRERVSGDFIEMELNVDKLLEIMAEKDARREVCYDKN